MYWIVAISIGFLGSAHCAGMCGPILLAVNQGKFQWKRDAIHHAGRLATYAVFGAIAGAFGQTFSVLGWQQYFSVIVGCILIMSVLLMISGKHFHWLESSISRIAIKFSGYVHQLKVNPTSVRFLGGVANGILPCGLVYMGVAGAANTYTPWDGALFMICFGIGTIPVLGLIAKFGGVLTPDFRTRMRKLIPITLIVMGALLVVRGSNFGIPYLSPKVEVDSGVAQCD